MYKILTQIHLNYKFKKITFKNIQNHGLMSLVEYDEIHAEFVQQQVMVNACGFNQSETGKYFE